MQYVFTVRLSLKQPKTKVQMIGYLHDPHQAYKNISQRFIKDIRFQG